VREYYQKKFRYVLVDEYQDTNHLQYLLATLLAGGRKNFCVVGDDDQSIYRFRGATIENILSFEQEYPSARVIRLEQNYRSTGHILEAANAVICNNDGRKGKRLWTDQGSGEKIQVFSAMNEQDEALHVAAELLKSYAEGRNFRDHAILYRMNAQSNQLEMALKRNSIPYKIVGGLRFFDRAEIKDVLSYLCVLQNPKDDLRLLRIINTPTRGIGAKALEAVQLTAAQEGLSLWELLLQVDRYPHLARSAARFRSFTDMMQTLQGLLYTLPLPELYDELLRATGYLSMLEEKREENATRLENVKELKSSIVGYLENTEEPSLAGFLDEVALYTDLDSYEDQNNSVTLMTMHSAKGLEYPVVFVVGMEEGMFPGFRAIGEREELEEERRLCYVALTRAKEVLHLSCAAQRMLFGRTSANLPSRFIKEIPGELVESDGRDYKYQNHTPFEDQWQKPSMEQPVSTPRQKPAGVPAERVSYRTPPKKTAPLPAFSKGDMVQHAAFGRGMLLSVQPMGGDALLEVAFDNVGTKRLMLKAAAQHMTKL
jgi:DNA helicase-2/ATP-dependent DNA helicase PcrA